jgi:hypothetical protein
LKLSEFQASIFCEIISKNSFLSHIFGLGMARERNLDRNQYFLINQLSDISRLGLIQSKLAAGTRIAQGGSVSHSWF